MNNNSRTPKIRFKGFTNDWKQRKFGDILKTDSFKAYLAVPSPDGKYKVIQQGDNPVVGYATGKPYQNYEDVVLFGDHTLSLYKPRSPFFVATDGLKILSGAVKTHGNYLLYLLEKNAPESEGYKRYYSILKDSYCYTTSDIHEQYVIGEFFATIDNLITLHQRKLKKINNIKKSLLIKLFPKGTNSVPEVRVSRFNSEWKKFQLRDVVTEIKRNDPNYDAPIMMISSRNGFIKQSDRYSYDNSGNSKNKYTLIFKGELSYNHGASKLRPFGSAFALKKEAAHVPFVYHSFDVNENDPYFMETVLNSKYVENQLRKIISSGARMDGLLNISFKEYSSIEVLLPSPEEQRIISAYLKEFDNLIDTTEKKLNKIKNIKESLLDKMIV